MVSELPSTPPEMNASQPALQAPPDHQIIDCWAIMFTILSYGSDNYFSSDKKAGGVDREFGDANGSITGAIHPFTPGAGAGD